MQRLAKEWAVEQKVRVAILKGLENVRRKRKEREEAKAKEKGTTVNQEGMEKRKQTEEEVDGKVGK